MKVELPELAARLAGRLNLELRELVQLDVSSAWPVFRAVTDDGREMFVKVTEKTAAERTLACLGSACGWRFGVPSRTSG